MTAEQEKLIKLIATLVGEAALSEETRVIVERFGYDTFSLMETKDGKLTMIKNMKTRELKNKTILKMR